MKNLNVYELVNSFHYFNDDDSFVTTNNSYGRDSRVSFTQIKVNKETFESYNVASFSVTYMLEDTICILVREAE